LVFIFAILPRDELDLIAFLLCLPVVIGGLGCLFFGRLGVTSASLVEHGPRLGWAGKRRISTGALRGDQLLPPILFRIRSRRALAKVFRIFRKKRPAAVPRNRNNNTGAGGQVAELRARRGQKRTSRGHTGNYWHLAPENSPPGCGWRRTRDHGSKCRFLRQVKVAIYLLACAARWRKRGKRVTVDRVSRWRRRGQRRWKRVHGDGRRGPLPVERKRNSREETFRIPEGRFNCPQREFRDCAERGSEKRKTLAGRGSFKTGQRTKRRNGKPGAHWGPPWGD